MKLVFLQSNNDKLKVVQNVIPLALVPFVGKPLLQRQLELAAEQGVTECTLICYHGADRIRRFCGDGERFGLKVTLSSSRPSESKVQTLLKHQYLFEEPFILALGSNFARIPLQSYYDDHVAAKRDLTIIEAERTGRPYGCIVSPGALALFKKGGFELMHFLERVRKSDQFAIERVSFSGHAAACQKLSDIIRLNHSTLDRPDLRPYDSLTEDTPGVFLGHHVRIHSGVQLIPPVSIGDFCTVSKNAVIGPNVTVASESVIGKGAKIKNSIVCESSYVGDMVSVKNSLICGSTIVNLKTGAKVNITDSFLLDNLEAITLNQYFSSLLQKGVAAGLLLALAPTGVGLALLSKIRTKKAIAKSQCCGAGEIADVGDIIDLPRFEKLTLGDDELPFSWYPGLFNVLKGDMGFIGPTPVSADDEECIQNNYSKRFSVAPGLIGLRAIYGDDEEAAKLAEVMYAHEKTLKSDARVLLARLALPVVGSKRATKIAGL